MTGPISMRFINVQQCEADIAKVASGIGDDVATYIALVGQFKEVWVGLSNENFETTSTRWNAFAEETRRLVAEMGTALETIRGNFENNEKSIAATFQ